MIFTEPRRLRILKSLTTALAEITPANGYRNNLSGFGTIIRGRAIFGENDPIPMVSILEPPLPPDRFRDPDESPATVGLWELVIQGFVQDEKDNPTDPAHILAADLLQRLALEKRKENGEPFALGFRCIRRLIIGPPVVRPPDNVISSKAYCWISFTIDLVEDLTKPYEDTD